LAFQAMFLSAPHSMGRCFSILVAEPFGPRNWGQSSPRARAGSKARSRPRAGRNLARMLGSFPQTTSESLQKTAAETGNPPPAISQKNRCVRRAVEAHRSVQRRTDFQSVLGARTD